jgi:membrane-bound metal-dependent hydrolase YbcI (DUF457 family)
MDMSNSVQHALIGGLIGCGLYLVAKRMMNEEPELGPALGCGLLGAGVALLPDIIEPATSPMHRAFAHSVATGGLVVLGTKSIYDHPEIPNEQKAVVGSLAGAYLSHLLLDAGTPAGLPPI